MATFAKVAVIGQAEGQEIVNLLYYAPNDATAGWPLSVVAREALADAVGAALQLALSDLISADYDGTEIQVSAVNERNEIVSDYVVIRPNPLTGDVAGGSDTVALAAICGFRCSAYTDQAGTWRTPKKSYLAVGPLASANIGDGGLLLWNDTEKGQVATVLSETLTAVGDDLLDWLPVRIGVPNQTNVPAVGLVTDVIVRPYTRPRKSRLFRANGR